MNLDRQKLAVIAGCVILLVAVIVVAATMPSGRGIFPVRMNGKYGFIDHSGKLKLQPQFDNAGEFKDGRAPVQMGAAWGYIDGDGKLLVNPQFQIADPFSDGLALDRDESEVRLHHGRREDRDQSSI